MSEPEDPLVRLGHIYLYASVPSYLIRRFREDPYVKELSENHSIDSLLREADIATEAPRTVKRTAYAYACVVAAGLKLQKIITEATSHKLPGLMWGRKILASMVEFSSEDADDGAPPRDDL